MSKPKSRWWWIAGVIAAFAVGIGAGSAAATAKPERTAAAAAAATVTRTAPAPAPHTYTRTAPAPPPVTVTATVTTAAAEPPPASGPAGAMSSGVYEVGVDVPPGQYKTSGPTGPMDMCYWSRNTNDSGDFEAIITNGIVEGPGSLTINAGEFVELSGGCEWQLVG